MDSVSIAMARLVLGLSVGFVLVLAPNLSSGQDVATIAQAREALDLSAWRLPDGADLLHPPRVATLGFSMPGSAIEALNHVRHRLTQLEWAESPGSVETENFASATFTKGGFRAAATITTGVPGERVQVAIAQLGNLQFDRLPLPGAQVLFSGPATAIFLADSPPEEFLVQLEPALAAAGWRPFGGSETMRSFIKQAVVINALVGASAAHEGKSTVSVTSYLVSHVFPLPDEYDDLHYADALAQLSFDSPQSMESLHGFYRESLQKEQWSATSEQPSLVELRSTQIFRKESGEMLTVGAQPLDVGCRATLRFYSAAEMERAREVAEQSPAMPPAEPLPEVGLKLPPGAAKVDQKPGRLEFTLPAGKALAGLDAMLATVQDKDRPWKIERVFWDHIAGTATYLRGDQELSVLFTDPGDAPAEVTITFRGIQVKLQTGD